MTSKDTVMYSEGIGGYDPEFLENVRPTSFDHLNRLCTLAGASAKEKGFRIGTPDRTMLGVRLMLVVSELTEALEEVRSGYSPQEIRFEGEKPVGFPVEIADAVIRLLDLADEYQLNLGDTMKMKMDYNATRPHKHGKEF